ncbi:MAG: amidohydrolase family protein [Lachnospiraceae bacterium]|nr:amidohydrolase family protein [Lachnospiraceae bacterium]
MKYALTNGAILDGTISMRPVRGKTVIVNDGIIEEIEDCDRVKLNGCKIIDMRNGYLMPGLINLCAHLSTNGYVGTRSKTLSKKLSGESLKKVAANPVLSFMEQTKIACRAKTELLSGVTTLVTENYGPGWVIDLRDKTDAGKKAGPRILISASSACTDGQPFGSAVTEVKNAGKKSAYVTTLASLFPYSHFRTDKTGLSEEDREKSETIFNNSLRQIATCFANKSLIGLGSGGGDDFVPHYSIKNELILLHKFCGFSNLQALNAATEVNAKIAGIDDITGRIAVGLEADLIVCAKNPLEDLNALSDLVLVMERGKLFRKCKYYTFPEVDLLWQPHLM